MDVHLNTLYVCTPGAYLRRDRQTIVVEVEKQALAKIPVHHLDGIAVFGPSLVSSGAVELCSEAGVALTFLGESGRLIARIDAPRSGNVLLRREQFRRAESPVASAALARSFVAGKVHNARNTLLRAAREAESPDHRATLEHSASILAQHVEALPGATELDAIRGHEGDSARIYFGAFPDLVRPPRRADFPMNGRSRRPPLDRVNALLSFTYALLLRDCVAALTAAGLDPDVGFLHADRPGRPSLALDLLEEFRTLVADRLVLALINRQQVGPADFLTREGGACELTATGRKAVIQAFIARKRDELSHPLLDTPVRVGLLPFLQARLLARHFRGDSESYVPCILR
jgi:CRISPR-associated protein Cas1